MGPVADLGADVIDRRLGPPLDLVEVDPLDVLIGEVPECAGLEHAWTTEVRCSQGAEWPAPSATGGSLAAKRGPFPVIDMRTDHVSAARMRPSPHPYTPKRS